MDKKKEGWGLEKGKSSGGGYEDFTSENLCDVVLMEFFDTPQFLYGDGSGAYCGSGNLDHKGFGLYFRVDDVLSAVLFSGDGSGNESAFHMEEV